MKTNVIHESFKHGNNFEIGNFCVIEEDVVVGDNVSLGHYVVLKKGTRFGNNIEFADCCITTGACWLGNNIAVRAAAVVSKSVIIEDWCFYGPGVITNHTKHVTHGRDHVKPKQLLTYIGFGSVIGSQVSILAGITIHPLSIIGAGAVVVKSTNESGIWIGSPCKKFMDLTKEYEMILPDNVGEMYRSDEILNHLKSYMPDLEIEG